MDLAISYLLLSQLLLLPFGAIAQTNSNVTLGSYLTAGNDNTTWKSPSGDFAFGFRPFGSADFLLAIWLDKIPEKTIVWSANGNNLVQRGSKVQLTSDGLLVLTNPKGQQIWVARPAGEAAGVAYAAMLDAGNFVLARRDSLPLWQTFEHPTDTMLPTQELNPGAKLTARFSEINYSNGRFQLLLQTDGRLVLYTTAFPLDTINSVYWSAGTAAGSGGRLIFRTSGNVDLVAAEGGAAADAILSSGSSTEGFYQRAVLDYDGVFRLYIYPKSDRSRNAVGNELPRSWTAVSLVPSDICTSITESTGGGACGLNAYCSLSGGRPICRCPIGYVFLDPTDERGGCKPGFVPQSCDDRGSEGEKGLFEMEEMVDTDWPLNDYGYFRPVSEEWCREACLEDCFCAVAIFRNGNCWKKRSPVSNGKFNPSIGGKALIKVRK